MVDDSEFTWDGPALKNHNSFYHPMTVCWTKNIFLVWKYDQEGETPPGDLPLLGVTKGPTQNLYCQKIHSPHRVHRLWKYVVHRANITCTLNTIDPWGFFLERHYVLTRGECLKKGRKVWWWKFFAAPSTWTTSWTRASRFPLTAFETEYPIVPLDGAQSWSGEGSLRTILLTKSWHDWTELWKCWKLWILLLWMYMEIFIKRVTCI